MSERRCDTMKILPFALILIGMLLIGGFVFIWFGVFNVAATEQHSELTLWLISVVRDRSIAERATSPSEPSLKDPQRLKAGFRSYHTMCAVTAEGFQDEIIDADEHHED